MGKAAAPWSCHRSPPSEPEDLQPRVRESDVLPLLPSTPSGVGVCEGFFLLPRPLFSGGPCRRAAGRPRVSLRERASLFCWDGARSRVPTGPEAPGGWPSCVLCARSMDARAQGQRDGDRWEGGRCPSGGSAAQGWWGEGVGGPRQEAGPAGGWPGALRWAGGPSEQLGARERRGPGGREEAENPGSARLQRPGDGRPGAPAVPLPRAAFPTHHSAASASTSARTTP